MRSRFSGWRFALVAAAVASLVLLPLSQALANGKSEDDFRGQQGGLRMAERGEDAPGKVATYSRANYVWPYANGPFYGAADKATGKGRAPGMLLTPVGTFDLSAGPLNFPEPLKAQDKLGELGVQYFIVQIDPAAAKQGSMTDVISAIENNGGAVVRAMPVMALIARVTPAAMAEIRGESGVIAIEPYHGALKLDPTIGRTPLIDPIKAVSEVYDLEVRIFEGEDASVVAQELAKLGGNVTSFSADTIRVEIHRAKLAQIAALQPVSRINEFVAPMPHGEETTTTVQTGRYNNGAVPYHDAGVDGSGGGIAAGPQVLMVLDSGIQIDAGDLSDTRTAAGSPGPAHRKVRFYGNTNAFPGGQGDDQGCDSGPSGGFTHGHTVSATAMGNATRVDLGTYGLPWLATDPNGNVWNLDGVAKGAVLVAYDGQPTPAATSCQDPLLNTISPGDLYDGGATGSLGQSYTNFNARIVNFSWGAPTNTYTGNAQDIDQFLLDKMDALVFVSAGNGGQDADNDGTPDLGSLGSPATAKNALAIGASRAANDLGTGGEEEERAFFSSTGPGPGNRVAPQLMAPGDEAGGGNMGLSSEFSCRTNDNDQFDPVECDTVSGKEGTSFASPAAAGAGLIVRDYFAQGYYPDGTGGNPGNAGDIVSNVSGALVKSVLIASAKYLIGDRPPAFSGSFPGGDNLTKRYRFNNEQGYGRIKLDNALPLDTWPASVSGLIVADGGIDGGVNSLPGLSGAVNVVTGEVDEATFEVCNGDDELRVALSWFDAVGDALVNDLDLELVAPDGQTVYRGNYFTDDDNRNGVIDITTEDCPDLDGTTGTITSREWSIPICQKQNGMLSPHDNENPTEAIMLSPDPLGNETVNQIQEGTWTIRVKGAGGTNTAQRYAVAIAGGVCQQSWARLDAVEYACNSTASATVYEIDEPGDIGPSESAVSGRTTLQVLAGGMVVDEESGLAFTQTGSRYATDQLFLTDGTERDPGNGVLDVRDGDIIQVTYEDVDAAGNPDPNKVRVSTANVNCAPRVGFGNIVFAQFGQDTTYFVSGGCERNARGNFEFGFPDRYMDAQEVISFNFAFASNEPNDIANVEVDLHCVIADTDSPEECRPNSIDCTDPNRTNNPSCDQFPSSQPGLDVQLMTILDTPKTIFLIPSGSSLSANFSIAMMDTIAGTPDIELILSVNAPTSGKTANAIAISRHKLDVDEQSFFYSTDFPTGGTEFFDINNARRGNEILENPNTNIGTFLEDYRFETKNWSDLTAGGTKNTNLQAPWHFDVTDSGFRSGILATTDESTITNTIAQWGEDKNFNNEDDKRCSNDVTAECRDDTECTGIGTCESVEQRDPDDTVLDKSWSTSGGCGWQTRAPGTCSAAATPCYDDADCPGDTNLCSGPAALTGGIWHTGRIGPTSGNCLVTGNNPGQCQAYETVGGTSGLRSWREHLITPVMQKVNGEDYAVEIVQWRWNQAVDLADSNVAWVWEFDTDVLSLEPVDLFSDNTVLNGLFGAYGAVDGSNNPRLTNGFSMFAPLDANMINSVNGTDVQGNNRVGKNSCFFEGGAVGTVLCPDCPNDFGDLGWTGPSDDDIDNDGDGQIDEFVTPTGPVRNMDIFAVNGPDMRFNTLEDLYGDTEQFFQGSVGMWNFEATPQQPAPAISYGLGIDDMVVEWREFTLVQDTTDCAAGECAVVDVTSNNTFEGSTLVTITVLEKSPEPANDCDLDGNPDGTNDCDGNGTPDVVVEATSTSEFTPEIVFANLTSNPNEYKADLPISARYDSPGVLFVEQLGTDLPVVTATYRDNNDGTGQICKNDVDPSAQGRVQSTTTLFINTGTVRLISTQATDNGDGDGIADTNETVNLQIRIQNKGQQNLTGVAARLATNDPKIDCILSAFIDVGDLAIDEVITTTGAFTFHVADVDRTGSGLSDLDNFSAEFQVLFSANEFDGLAAPTGFTIDLDLDAVGGGGPTTFFDGFERNSDIRNANNDPIWEQDNIDAGRNNFAGADGYRCQYSDPDWVGSNSYGAITDCFMGASPDQADDFFWQIHQPSAIDGGKAFTGTRSLYMGIFGPAADEHTTPMSVLEAIKTRDPINLGFQGAPPEMSIKSQIDLLDSRTVNAPVGDSPARGIAMVQLADGTGTGVGDWVKLQPYLNIYDQQGVDNYFNCVFDPVDDGNDEDDFFDPTDPDRRLGPSSTCKPAFAWTYQGETFNPFNENNLGNAEGPGLQGSLGIGTWVETRFNLERFKGRRIRLRFLNTDLKAGSFETWEQIFTFNPSPGDDGWWLDDIQITNVLTDPATITNDDKDNSALPGCGNTCNTITPAVSADPPGGLPAPGQVVELSALASMADRCLNGVLQFQFWQDGNGNGAGGDLADTLLRGWTDNSEILDAPQDTTQYVVDVRCSTDTACTASTSLTVSVSCPASGNLSFPTVLAISKTTLQWGAALTHDWVKGPLANVSSYAVSGSAQNQGPGSTFDISGDLPLAGQGFYYLFRQSGTLGSGATGFCNAPGITWGNAARDAVLP